MVGDELLIYFNAFSRQQQQPCPFGTRSIGVAKLRRDGFAGLQAAAEEAEGGLTTRPLHIAGDRLLLNVEQRGGEGTVIVALLDEQENELPGFGFAESLPITSDAVRAGPLEDAERCGITPRWNRTGGPSYSWPRHRLLVGLRRFKRHMNGRQIMRRIIRPGVRLVMVIAMCLPAACSGQNGSGEGEYRTFTDSRGRTVQARVVRVEGDQVTIQRRDGKQFTVPMATFSPADQEFLRRPAPAKTATRKTAKCQAGGVRSRDWDRFRGPTGMGVADSTGLPIAMESDRGTGLEDRVAWRRSVESDHVRGPHLSDRLHRFFRARRTGRQSGATPATSDRPAFGRRPYLVGQGNTGQVAGRGIHPRPRFRSEFGGGGPGPDLRVLRQDGSLRLRSRRQPIVASRRRIADQRMGLRSFTRPVQGSGLHQRQRGERVAGGAGPGHGRGEVASRGRAGRTPSARHGIRRWW